MTYSPNQQSADGAGTRDQNTFAKEASGLIDGMDANGQRLGRAQARQPAITSTASMV